MSVDIKNEIIQKIWNKIRVRKNTVGINFLTRWKNVQFISDENLFEPFLVSRSPETGIMSDFNNSVYLIPEAAIFGESGLARYQNKIVISDVTPRNYPEVTSHFTINDIIFRPKPEKFKILKNKYVIRIGNNWSNNYFHWLIEELPRLTFATQMMKLDLKDLCLASPYPLNKFQKSSLEIIGFPLENVLPVNKIPIKTDKFIVLSPSRHQRQGKRSYPSKSLINSLKSMIFDKLSISNSTQINDEICWISRGNVWGRQLKSEDNIIQALKEAGYNVFLYHPGQHSFEDQVKTFHKYKFFIGPHGGALTNIIWSDDACLIELFGDKVVNRSYEALCQILSFDYYRITGESNDSFWKGNRKDYYIDPVKAIEVVKKINEERSLKIK